MAPSLVDRWRSLRPLPAIRAEAGLAYHDSLQLLLQSLDGLKIKDLTSACDGEEQHALDSLDPALDTIPYAHVLLASVYKDTKLSELNPDCKPGTNLWQKLNTFMLRFEPVEARYVGKPWRKLLEALTLPTAYHTDKDILQLPPTLSNAMLRMDSSAGTFTSLHLRLAQLSLHTQSYGGGSGVLGKNIHSFPETFTTAEDELYPCSRHPLSSSYITINSGLTDSIDVNDVVEYYLLAGMAFIGLENWKMATQMLDHVLSVPTTGQTGVQMVEAYKKWLFTNLMATGRVPEIPRIANQSAMRNVKNVSKAYASVVAAFALPDIAKLKAEIHEGMACWTEDGNLGLTQKLIHKHEILSIQSLQRIYAAIPVINVSQKLGKTESETESYLDKLITQGQLNASLEKDKDDSRVLRFSKAGNSNVSEAQLREQLLKQTRSIQELQTAVSEADARLSLTKEYVEHVRKARRLKERQTGSQVPEEESMDMAYAQMSDEDENVMADVA